MRLLGHFVRMNREVLARKAIGWIHKKWKDQFNVDIRLLEISIDQIESRGRRYA